MNWEFYFFLSYPYDFPPHSFLFILAFNSTFFFFYSCYYFLKLILAVPGLCCCTGTFFGFRGLGLLSSCSARVSRGGGFSCGAQNLGALSSVVTAWAQ